MVHGIIETHDKKSSYGREEGWAKTEFCHSLDSYVEALTLSVAVYGDGAFREIIKLKWSKGGVLIWYIWWPYKKTKEEVIWAHRDGGICKLGRVSHQEPNRPGPRSLTFKLLKLLEDKFILFKPHVFLLWEPKLSKTGGDQT